MSNFSTIVLGKTLFLNTKVNKKSKNFSSCSFVAVHHHHMMTQIILWCQQVPTCHVVYLKMLESFKFKKNQRFIKYKVLYYCSVNNTESNNSKQSNSLVERRISLVDVQFTLDCKRIKRSSGGKSKNSKCHNIFLIFTFHCMFYYIIIISSQF